MTQNTRTDTFSELVSLGTLRRLDLLGTPVQIDIRDGDETAAVVGTIQALTFVDGGVVVKIEGIDEVIPVSAEELPSVSLTYYDYGVKY